jgi:hypothetical protein
LQAEWKSRESCAPDLWWFLCILLPCYFNWTRVSLEIGSDASVLIPHIDLCSHKPINHFIIRCLP